MPKRTVSKGIKRSKSESFPNELPPCDGPKLRLFEHHDQPIQWLERLDVDEDSDGSDDGSSAEAYVFRVRIMGQEYAIKIFKFFDPLSTAYYWGPLIGSKTPLDIAAYYTDPFYAECRAYGCIDHAIRERQLRKDIAVPCHGYLFLREDDQQALENRGLDLGFNHPHFNINYQSKTPGGLRVRAILKDLASHNPGVDEKSLRHILAGIKALNKHKIYNRDIGLNNFRDGKIVDFGSSWTEPHMLLNALDEQAATGLRLADKVQFDEMVEDEEIPNPRWIRGMPNTLYRKKLRPRRK